MKPITKADWDLIHELACEIANAASQEDAALTESKTEALMCLLHELEAKYGPCSRITATMADYTEKDRRLALYQRALQQAKAECDTENESIILESLAEIAAEKQT
jgi:hypothetical protein